MSKLTDTLRTLLAPITHSIGKKPDRSEIPSMIPHIPTKLAEMKDDPDHRTVTDEAMSYWDSKSEFDGNYNNLFNRPTLSTVATSGEYNDLSNVPAKKIISDSHAISIGSVSGTLSESICSEIVNSLTSFMFCKAPIYGGVAYLTTEYAYRSGVYTKATVYDGLTDVFSYWGNGSLHSTDLEDTGETWCVCIRQRVSSSGIYNDVGELYTYNTVEAPAGMEYSTRTITYETLEDALIPSTIARTSDLFSGSYPDLTEKPVSAEPKSINIEWDGTAPEGVDSFTIGTSDIYYYKFSDEVPDPELITSAYAEVSDGKTGGDILYGTNCYQITPSSVAAVLVVTEAGAGTRPKGDSFTAPSTGVYLYWVSDKYASKCQIEYEVVEQLDEKYIPDTIARTADIPPAMPAADGAFKQLVTDADGNTKWEERVGYKDWDYVEESDIPVGIYSQGYGSLPFELFPVEGEEYTVTWDGTQYSCPATIITINDENVTIIGSTTFFGGTVAPDIPVGICCRSGKATVYSNESGEHTIGVSGYVMYPVKIPREYIDWNPVVGVIDSSWYNYRYLNEARGASIAEIRKAAREKNKDIIIRLDLDNWQGTIRYLGLIDVSEDGETYFPALVFSTIKTNNASINVADETINGTMDLEYWYTPLEPTEGPPANAFVNLQFGKINLNESEQPRDSIPIVDKETGTTYILEVSNGSLTMTEVTE